MKTDSKIHVVLFTLILMVFIPISAFGVDGQRKLTQPVPPASFPIVISASGSYVLTSNLVVSADQQDVYAIEIMVNDVTIDLNGHMIQGPNTGSPWEGGGIGIFGDDKFNITIKNGRIWGFGYAGIRLISSTSGSQCDKGAGHYIDKIQAANNGFAGIMITAGVVTNCTANNNGGTGISATWSTITNCTANGNVGEGINGDRCSITNSSACHNNRNGVNVYFSMVTNCTANENTMNGINSSSSTITNCTTVGNTETGIDAEGSTITNCTNFANSEDGINASYSTIITNCTCYRNEGDGIEANSSNRIEGNNLIQNTGYGLLINSEGINNYLIKNTASNNTVGGFQIPGGSNNYVPICGVDTTDNCNYDF